MTYADRGKSPGRVTLQKIAAATCAVGVAAYAKARRTTFELREERLVRRKRYSPVQLYVGYDQIASITTDNGIVDLILDTETLVLSLKTGGNVRLEHVPTGTRRTLERRVAERVD